MIDCSAPVMSQRPGKILSEKSIALVPATQEVLVDDNGNRLPYPFLVPTPLQLLQSAFGDEYASEELGVGHSPTEAASVGSASAVNPRNTVTAASSAHGSQAEGSQIRMAASPFLRWVPFGLTRKLSGVAPGGVRRMHARVEDASTVDFPDNEQLFVEALSKGLPQRWLESPDG